MRILFVIHQFFPEFGGGTERVALGLARQAQHAGHAVHVLACAVSPQVLPGATPSATLAGALDCVHEGVAVTLLPRQALPAAADIGFEVDADWSEALQAWIGAMRFDLAHVFHTMRMGSALHALHQTALPYLLTLTDFFPACFRINLQQAAGRDCAGPDGGRRCAADCGGAPWTAAELQRRYAQSAALLRGAGARYCPSDYVAQRYRAIYPELEFDVLGHGIDALAMIAGGLRATPLARAAGAPLRLGCIGNVIAQKGLKLLLEALARAPDADVTLVVLGGRHGDPAYHREIDRLIALDARVSWLGQATREQVFATLADIDLLCLPSQVPETYSLILHEAAAAGVPALVGDLGAPADSVRASGAGRVVPAADVDAWAAAIGDAARDAELCAQWRERLPLPPRIEEEAFFYESIYLTLAGAD
jgi:glycosyltransferase involved in cell wall biosynthesis